MPRERLRKLTLLKPMLWFKKTGFPLANLCHVFEVSLVTLFHMNQQNARIPMSVFNMNYLLNLNFPDIMTCTLFQCSSFLLFHFNFKAINFKSYSAST